MYFLFIGLLLATDPCRYEVTTYSLTALDGIAFNNIKKKKLKSGEKLNPLFYFTRFLRLGRCKFYYASKAE